MLKSMGLRCAFVAFACMACGFVGATPKSVDVQAGELVDALETLARQCDIDIIYPASQLRGLTTHGVSGTLEPKEALEKLLEGTSLVLQEEAGAMLITQSASGLAPRQKPAGPLSEVEINARRQKLSVMQADMMKLENLFYTRYNKLNSDHDFDIFCDLEPLPNSRIKARVCRPEFLIRAMGATLGGSTLSAPPAPGENGGGAASDALVARNLWIPDETWAEYKKNMLDLINTHPELRNLVREREVLGKHYEEILKAKLKGKAFVFD